jgi:predicted DNA-binding transcriptional regulator AlpA
MTFEKRYSRKQVSEMLGCHPITLDRHVRKGEFPPPEKILGRPTWRESVLVKYFNERKMK